MGLCLEIKLFVIYLVTMVLFCDWRREVKLLRCFLKNRPIPRIVLKINSVMLCVE